MKKLITILILLLLTCGTLGFTSNYPTETEKLRMILEGQTLQVKELKVEVLTLKLEVGKLVSENKENKLVLETVHFLTEGAVQSRWADPNHIRNVIDVCKKYEYLGSKVGHQYSNWKFIFSRCLATGLDPNFHCDNDGNGKYDNGLADLNDVCLEEIEKELPKELQRRSWYNIEKSVAGLYVWINQKHRAKLAWAYLNPEQWKYYARIATL